MIIILWHVDQHVMPTSEGKYRKLSSTIQLSDPDDYEGGLILNT